MTEVGNSEERYGLLKVKLIPRIPSQIFSLQMVVCLSCNVSYYD